LVDIIFIQLFSHNNSQFLGRRQIKYIISLLKALKNGVHISVLMLLLKKKMK
jgi:hypothetical protein